MMHEIVLNGYTAHNSNNRCLHFGTAESYGIEQIRITPGADWENLLIKATFHPPSGDSVVVLLGEDGIIDVPPEATAVAAGEYNPGLIVFSGVSDGVQRISANLAYTVIGHASVDGKDSEPTPSQWEQLAAQYQSKIDKQQGAENAGKVLGIGEDGLVKPMEQTGGGGVGNNGATFIPSVDKDGFISWTNDGDLPNPEPVNIKGAPGKPGNDYVLTEADKQEIAQEAANKVKIPTALPNPNALTFTGAVEGTYDGSAPLTVEIPKIKEYTLPSASETALGGVKAPAKTEDMTQPVGIGEDGFLFTAPGASGDGDWETLVDFVAEEEVVEVNFQLQKGGCFSELVFLINTVLPGAFVENIDEYIYAVLGNTGGGDFTVGRLLHTFPTTNIANVYLADTSCFVRTMYARDSYSNKDYAVFSRTAPNKSTVIDTLTVFTQNWKNPFGVGTKIVILGKRV